MQKIDLDLNKEWNNNFIRVYKGGCLIEEVINKGGCQPTN